MTELGQAALLALNLILGLDPELFAIVGLSLRVSLSATVIAFVLGAALGTALALIAFPGRRAMVIVVNALLGLPPVVVGLLVYLLLSRSGPLGSLGLLFTPGAMIIAQAILGTPIVAALVHRAIEGLWRDYGDALQMDGASLSRAGFELLAMAKAALLTTFLAAFGRAIAEVGAIHDHGHRAGDLERRPRLSPRPRADPDLLKPPREHPRLLHAALDGAGGLNRSFSCACRRRR
jgi:tungstate transport system permease protein